MAPARNEVSIIHTPRHYQAFSGSKYALPHDDEEQQRPVPNVSAKDMAERTTRLLLQHWILKSLFEDRILLAPVSLGPNDKVLDIGTGSGLWLMDLAATVESTVFMVGVDIESRLFPTSPSKNIEFQVESVTSLPLEWTETFSLVHQRLLIFGLEMPQWPKAIQEIHRVLRFGGWVQFVEVAPWKEDKYPGKPYLEKYAAMHDRLAKSRNFDADCADRIPRMLEEAGFVDIQSEVRMQVIGRWAGQIGVACATNQVGLFRGMKTPVLEAGGLGVVTSEAEYDELVDGLEKEWDEIPGTEKEFIIIWARKPLA
ncbi:S-adenosyl-L-methionine-dependent methyltransferase [Mycena galopus ATCC 62051]|nr:S-adenosyl-L-methionine-dependent methyltransferase [Mycena galopus ATCC 62051]